MILAQLVALEMIFLESIGSRFPKVSVASHGASSQGSLEHTEARLASRRQRHLAGPGMGWNP